MRWHHKDGRSIDEHKTCIFETFGNPSLREGLRALCEEIAFEQEISGFYSRYAHQSWKNVISIGATGMFEMIPSNEDRATWTT